MMPTTLLSAQSLSRYYGNQLAVNEVDFKLSQGEVLGFLGPNGAGKSTSMKMLSGNLAPDYGHIQINGFDLLSQPKQAKAHIGYLPEQPPLYKELSVKEFLSFCVRLNLIPANSRQAAINSVIDRCGLGKVQKRLIGHLSKGYQQRVGIAQAIIHNPAVVILDEPTSGLDPIQIREIRQLIRDIANEHSVILSTHILPEVQMLCDRVQIINQGKIVFSGDVSTLSEQRQSSSFIVSLGQPPVLTELESIAGITSIDNLDHKRFRVNFLPEHNPIDDLVRKSVQQNWQLLELRPEQRSLEDVFMNIIQQESSEIEKFN